MIRHKY